MTLAGAGVERREHCPAVSHARTPALRLWALWEAFWEAFWRIEFPRLKKTRHPLPDLRQYRVAPVFFWAGRRVCPSILSA